MTFQTPQKILLYVAFIAVSISLIPLNRFSHDPLIARAADIIVAKKDAEKKLEQKEHIDNKRDNNQDINSGNGGPALDTVVATTVPIINPLDLLNQTANTDPSSAADPAPTNTPPAESERENTYQNAATSTPTDNRPPIVNQPDQSNSTTTHTSPAAATSTNNQTNNNQSAQTPTFTPAPPNAGGPLNTASSTPAATAPASPAPTSSPAPSPSNPAIKQSRPAASPTQSSATTTIQAKVAASGGASGLTSVFDVPETSVNPEYYSAAGFDGATTRFLLAYAALTALIGVFLSMDGLERFFGSRTTVHAEA